MFTKGKLKYFLIFLTILTVGSVGFLAISHFYSEDSEDVAQLNEVPLENPGNLDAMPRFGWQFKESNSDNLDGLPKTDIFLTANYGNRDSVEKLIDVVDGGCSELEREKHEGDVSNTGKVQCYYAGLGQVYRITKGTDYYLVEKKLFEESLPNVTPLGYKWEVIEKFSF